MPKVEIDERALEAARIAYLRPIEGGCFAPSMRAALVAYDANKPVEEDVIRLVVAARAFAYSDPFPEDKIELDQALEAFAERVRWADEPDKAHHPKDHPNGQG